MTDDWNVLLITRDSHLSSSGANHEVLRNRVFRRCRSENYETLFKLEPNQFSTKYLWLLERVIIDDQVARLLSLGEFSIDDLSNDLKDYLPGSLMQILQNCESNRPENESKLVLSISNNKGQKNDQIVLNFILKEFLSWLHIVQKVVSKLAPVFESTEKIWVLNRLDDTTKHVLFQLTAPHRKRIPRLQLKMLNLAKEVLKDQDEDLLRRLRELNKNWVALSKCEILKSLAMADVHCRLCEELFEIEVLADHSFVCFEKQIIYKEVEKINKMIVKLSTTCGKLRSKLCRNQIT